MCVYFICACHTMPLWLCCHTYQLLSPIDCLSCFNPVPPCGLMTHATYNKSILHLHAPISLVALPAPQCWVSAFYSWQIFIPVSSTILLKNQASKALDLIILTFCVCNVILCTTYLAHTFLGKKNYYKKVYEITNGSFFIFFRSLHWKKIENLFSLYIYIYHLTFKYWKRLSQKLLPRCFWPQGGHTHTHKAVDVTHLISKYQASIWPKMAVENWL